MKISEILRKAADEHLKSVDDYDEGRMRYSCNAVSNACSTLDRNHAENFKRVMDFLIELGVDCGRTDNGINPQFANDFEAGPERQGARFLWLDFAALVAEDEGL